MKKIISTLAIFTFCLSLLCQNKSSKIDSLLTIAGPKDLIDQSIKIMMSNYDSTDISQDFKDSIAVCISDMFSEIKDSMNIMYQKKFNDKEIDELISFYTSDLGKKSIGLSLDYVKFINNNRSDIAARFQNRLSNIAKHFEKPDTTKRSVDYVVNKPVDFNTSVKSQKQPIELFYNDKLWKSIPPSDLNPIAEICLANLENDMYAMLITEPTVMKLETFKQAIIINTRKKSQNLNIIDQSLKLVNGKEVLSLVMTANVNNIDLVYQWYLYSSQKGSMQYLVFTTRDLYNSNRKDFENILNGLVIK
jgi:hypothetical protein